MVSKKVTLLSIASALFLFNTNITAQVGEGGTPPSFNFENRLRFAQKATTSKIDFDVEQLKKEDAITDRNGSPMRIAMSVPVEVDINKTGKWMTLPDGQEIWQQVISLPDAKGIIVSYKDFYIPEGGKLFLYTADKSQVIGAYTHNTNPGGGEFSTENLHQDEIILEYVASTISDEKPRIELADVGYIYKASIWDDLDPGSSKSCHINVNCEEGNDWQKQKRGVVHMQMQFGRSWYVCSASLVNNVRQDKTPYILTAEHCFVDGNTTANYNTSQYYFFYETKGCTGTQYETPQVLIGVTPKVIIPIKGGSDGALVELKTAIPEEWEVYYNGWDATGVAATSGVVIHHPAGDLKKISTYTKTLRSEGNLEYEVGYPTAANGHWEVYYAQTTNGKGVTEGGSSGSPLFAQNGLIVGTLTGGSSSCVRDSDGSPTSPDDYGKLWYHFDQYSDNTKHMKTYLDPDNTGVRTLAGYDPISGIEENHVSSPKVDIVIFPNPLVDELNISAGEIMENIKVYDLSGKLMAQVSNHNASTITIPASAWARGIYSVVIKTDKGSQTYKVIK